jgi:hypothetical protein
MPKIIRRFLFSRELKWHFKTTLLIGLVTRVICAIFVYGPQALDDYKHGVWPAYQWFAGLPLELPEYRSHLLVWVLGSFLKIGSIFGVSSALAQVRTMYIGLALVSLLGVYGTYLFARTWRSKIGGGLALYLVVLFPLMPFVSTRAFGEALALNLVLLAFGLLEKTRNANEASLGSWVLGFLVLGISVLFRFHIGLMYVAYICYLVVEKNWKAVSGATIAGLTTLVAQALIDLLSGKAPLGTLFIYLSENEGGGAKYGVSPWYNPLIFVLMLTLAPFSLPLFTQLKNLWRFRKSIWIPALLFVIAHCLAAHKEERFLYPVVGLELWALAYLWSANSFNRFSRKIYSKILIGLTVILLPLICFVNTQEGEIEPPAYTESRYHHVIYFDQDSLFGKSRFQFYFLRPPSVLKSVESSELTATAIDEALIGDVQADAVVLLTSALESKDFLRALSGISTDQSRCKSLRESGSIIDRLLYSLNPKHNQRRKPTWYLICERAANAGNT